MHVRWTPEFEARTEKSPAMPAGDFSVMLTLLPSCDYFPTFRNAGNYSAGETASYRGIPLSSATRAVGVTRVREPKGNISSNPKINVDST